MYHSTPPTFMPVQGQPDGQHFKLPPDIQQGGISQQPVANVSVHNGQPPQFPQPPVLPSVPSQAMQSNGTPAGYNSSQHNETIVNGKAMMAPQQPVYNQKGAQQGFTSSATTVTPQTTAFVSAFSAMPPAMQPPTPFPPTNTNPAPHPGFGSATSTPAKLTSSNASFNMPPHPNTSGTGIPPNNISAGLPAAAISSPNAQPLPPYGGNATSVNGPPSGSLLPTMQNDPNVRPPLLKGQLGMQSTPHPPASSGENLTQTALSSGMPAQTTSPQRMPTVKAPHASLPSGMPTMNFPQATTVSSMPAMNVPQATLQPGMPAMNPPQSSPPSSMLSMTPQTAVPPSVPTINAPQITLPPGMPAVNPPRALLQPGMPNTYQDASVRQLPPGGQPLPQGFPRPLVPTSMPAGPPGMPGAYTNMTPTSMGYPPPTSGFGAGAPMVGPPQPGDMMGPAGPGGLYQQKPRLDPNMMPSIAQVIEEDRSTRSGVFPTGFPTAEFPPLTTTEYIATDEGNCNPKYMRASMYVAPASSDMLKNSQMPFVIAISPIAKLHPSEMQPPVVDLGDLGPVRCHRCKAYMCPFMEFQDGGRRFKCPFCLAMTSVEDAYFAHLDHTGRRTDYQYRPEQCLGTYEFVATKPYCKNGMKPKEPAFLFMLDVSYAAVHSGLVSVFCRHIRGILMNLPKDVGEEKSSMRIGFATYDQTIHFYNLKSQMGQPEMLVVTDINDVFVPLVDGFLVTLEEAEGVLESLLREIEKMFADTRITEVLLGPVIQAGLDALKCADRAGKLFIFHTNLPLMDAPGKLKNRDDRKLLGTDKEKVILQPGSDFYSKLGEECVKAGCVVDLFLFPNAFVDVASLSPVCKLTGGSVYKYQYFEEQKDGVRFLADLANDVSRAIIFDVMMRVRTSTGLRPTGFFGSFYMDNSTDMEMGALDCDKAIHVEIRHDDKLPEGNAYIQAAILFTSCSGQRRLRIHNLAMPVCTDYNQLYRMSDPDCLISFLFKQAEYFLRDKSPKDMREAVSSRSAQMLATYREKCSEQAPLGQLILPECLKLLPLYANCITKSDALSGGSDLTVDDRAYLMQLVPSLSTENALSLLYPTVLPVTDLAIDQQTNEVIWPARIRASYDNMSPDKAYIIYNGITLFLWIGLKVPQEWVMDVFNSNSVVHLNVESNVIPERDNLRSRALRSVIETVNRNSLRHMKTFLIRQQDGLEAWMKKYLVEDRTSNMPSYVDYLCSIHREIRSILS